MTFPTRLPEGMFRDLQNQLNTRQKDLTVGLQKEDSYRKHLTIEHSPTNT